MNDAQPKPLLSNGDLEKLAQGILHLNKDRQFAVYERFIFIRGTYERELERLRHENEELSRMVSLEFLQAMKKDGVG